MPVDELAAVAVSRSQSQQLWDELAVVKSQLGTLVGEHRALTMALKQVEESSIDYFDRGVRQRKGIEAERRTVERLIERGLCPECRMARGDGG